MTVNSRKRALFFRQARHQAVRLPWLRPGLEFTADCSRCGNCKPACPEQIIIIGDGGFPELDFSRGECSFCRACVTSCEEDLFDLSPEAAWHYKAKINDSCFNADAVYCRSCAESCEAEAISFNFVDSVFVKPTVTERKCNGCGACVAVCPAKAIIVTDANANN